MTILSADQIHQLQENVSKWLTQLSGMHVHSNKTEFIFHLTQIGHFEILQLFNNHHAEPDAFKINLEKYLNLLNRELAEKHSSYLRLLGGRNNSATLREYATSVRRCVDTFFQRMTRSDTEMFQTAMVPWGPNNLPNNVKEKYDMITNALAHWG